MKTRQYIEWMLNKAKIRKKLMFLPTILRNGSTILLKLPNGKIKKTFLTNSSKKPESAASFLLETSRIISLLSKDFLLKITSVYYSAASPSLKTLPKDSRGTSTTLPKMLHHTFLISSKMPKQLLLKLPNKL